jgi:hypothetical protein
MPIVRARRNGASASMFRQRKIVLGIDLEKLFGTQTWTQQPHHIDLSGFFMPMFSLAQGK